MFWINSSGWYRVAKYEGTGLAEAQGSRGNSTLFSLKSTYNNVENMSVYGTLNCSYARSNIVILSSSIAHPVVSKIRHTVDTKNSVTYLEIYYSTNSSNAISLELTNNKVESNVWRILDIPELTQETTENISVYSNADLIAKERNVIVNSDITGTNVEITTETLFTPEKYNRAIKNNSMVFLNIAGVANINSTSTWTKIMTLPSVCAPLTDVFGCVILNGTSDVIPVYIPANGSVYISPSIVLNNKGIRGSLCYFIGK